MLIYDFYFSFVCLNVCLRKHNERPNLIEKNSSRRQRCVITAAVKTNLEKTHCFIVVHRNVQLNEWMGRRADPSQIKDR